MSSWVACRKLVSPHLGKELSILDVRAKVRRISLVEMLSRVLFVEFCFKKFVSILEILLHFVPNRLSFSPWILNFLFQIYTQNKCIRSYKSFSFIRDRNIDKMRMLSQTGKKAQVFAGRRGKDEYFNHWSLTFCLQRALIREITAPRRLAFCKTR